MSVTMGEGSDDWAQEAVWTGGCLCGAVRYRVARAPEYASYWRCEMCRKASGAPSTAFVKAPEAFIDWECGPPDSYASSTQAVRRFCKTFGSSLTFEGNGVAFATLGSLDRPEAARFHCHTCTSSRLPGMDLADGLPQCRGPACGKGGRSLR